MEDQTKVMLGLGAGVLVVVLVATRGGSPARVVTTAPPPDSSAMDAAKLSVASNFASGLFGFASAREQSRGEMALAQLDASTQERLAVIGAQRDESLADKEASANTAAAQLSYQLEQARLKSSENIAHIQASAIAAQTRAQAASETKRGIFGLLGQAVGLGASLLLAPATGGASLAAAPTLSKIGGKL